MELMTGGVSSKCDGIVSGLLALVGIGSERHIISMSVITIEKDDRIDSIACNMELMTGFEPVTSSLPRMCATCCATLARTRCSTVIEHIVIEYRYLLGKI